MDTTVTTAISTTTSTTTTITDTAEQPLERLEADICRGSADVTAAEHDWLLLVAEFDRRRGWERWECVSCAHWLSWQVGLNIKAAREKVRVANALAEFPVVAAAMANGALSYSKVRAITRVVTPATEADLVGMALAGTTNQVERIVSAFRRAAPVEDERAQRQWERRGLHHETQSDGSVLITLRVPPEAAAAFLARVEQYVTPAEVGADGIREPLAARRADAAVAMAEAADAGEAASKPRYLVTLHADVEALLGAEGRCDVASNEPGLEAPVGVSVQTALRMLCDCDVEAVLERDGEPVHLTKRKGVVRGRLRRKILQRDGCCQFPGCGRRVGVDIHHLRHRWHGGDDNEANLTVLCRFHHHRVHEGGWTAVRGEDGLVFRAPDGREPTHAPSHHRGNAAAVRASGRTADDGRCRWGGEPLDLDLALTALFSAEDSLGSLRDAGAG